LSIAKGSCEVTGSQLYRALDFHYLGQPEFDDLLRRALQLSRRISALMHYLKHSNLRGTKFR
jgi:four helix bundle protein